MGGAQLAYQASGNLLFMTHFRSNSLQVYDLSLGAFGEPIRRIADIGENPYALALSPDEKTLVVANYVGEVDDAFVSSTAAVLDVDSQSETYLEVLTWLVNR